MFGNKSLQEQKNILQQAMNKMSEKEKIQTAKIDSKVLLKHSTDPKQWRKFAKKLGWSQKRAMRAIDCIAEQIDKDQKKTRSYEDQIRISKKASKKVLTEVDSILKSTYLLEALLENVDNLEHSNIYEQEFKRSAELFKKQLEKINDFLFSNHDARHEQEAQAITSDAIRLHEAVDNIHHHYYDEAAEILEHFLEHGKRSTELRVDSLIERQYAKVSDFMMPKQMITQLKKVFPMIDDMFIVQIAQSKTKKELIAYKGIGEETINFLDSIFKSANIKW